MIRQPTVPTSSGASDPNPWTESGGGAVDLKKLWILVIQLVAIMKITGYSSFNMITSLWIWSLGLVDSSGSNSGDHLWSWMIIDVRFFWSPKRLWWNTSMIHDEKVSQCWRKLVHLVHLPQSARISWPGRCSAESKLKICKACWWGWCWALWAVSCVSHCEPARPGGEVKALRLFHQFFDDFQKIGLDFATLGGSSVAMFFTMFFDGLDSPWFSMTAAISGGPRVPAPRSLSVNHPATFFRALCLSLGWDSQEPKTTQTTKFLLGIWSLGKHQNWLFCRVYVMYVWMYNYI